MENNNIKKYVSLEKLGLYDSKIKEFLATADEATLEAAKAYAEEKLAEAAAAHKSDVDALGARVKAVEDDYLTSTDKTELSNAIGAETERATGAEEALTQAIAAEKERAEGAEAGLQNQLNTIMNNPDAEGAINSINEFTQYVAEHGTIAEGMRQDINKNKDDIAAEASRAAAAEEALAGRVKDIEDNKAGYVTTTEVAAVQNAVDAEIERATAKEAELQAAIDAFVEITEEEILALFN